MDTRRWKRHASTALATFLGALSPLTLSLCGSGVEVNGLKLEATGIKVDNVNVGGGGQGADPAAGQPGRTEYPGRTLVCTATPAGTRCE